jgi:hypothetical protein
MSQPLYNYYVNKNVLKMLNRSVAPYAKQALYHLSHTPSPKQTFWGNGSAPHLSWHDDFSRAICQNPSNCTFKVCAV